MLDDPPPELDERAALVSRPKRGRREEPTDRRHVVAFLRWADFRNDDAFLEVEPADYANRVEVVGSQLGRRDHLVALGQPRLLRGIERPTEELRPGLGPDLPLESEAAERRRLAGEVVGIEVPEAVPLEPVGARLSPVPAEEIPKQPPSLGLFVEGLGF
jgi:hypothetical protein